MEARDLPRAFNTAGTARCDAYPSRIEMLPARCGSPNVGLSSATDAEGYAQFAMLVCQSIMNRRSCMRASSALSIVMPKFSLREEMIETVSS